MTKGAPKKDEPGVAGDPRLGAVAEQLTLAKALGLKHVVVAVNKMDGKPSARRGHLPGSGGPGGDPVGSPLQRSGGRRLGWTCSPVVTFCSDLAQAWTLRTMRRATRRWAC